MKEDYTDGQHILFQNFGALPSVPFNFPVERRPRSTEYYMDLDAWDRTEEVSILNPILIAAADCWCSLHNFVI
jgi:hypothetical protein